MVDCECVHARGVNGRRGLSTPWPPTVYHPAAASPLVQHQAAASADGGQNLGGVFNGDEDVLQLNIGAALADEVGDLNRPRATPEIVGIDRAFRWTLSFDVVDDLQAENAAVPLVW